MTLHASCHVHVYVESPEGESRWADLPLKLVAMSSGIYLRVDADPALAAMDELEAGGAMERERLYALEKERRARQAE